MSTARLTWLVLDRLVPTDDEAHARSVLIARDPELRSLVDQGMITEDQAIASLRARQLRHRDPDDSVIWMTPLAVGCMMMALAFLALVILR